MNYEITVMKLPIMASAACSNLAVTTASRACLELHPEFTTLHSNITFSRIDLFISTDSNPIRNADPIIGILKGGPMNG